MTDERNLLVNVRDAKKTLDELKEKLKEAQKAYDKAEAEIVEFLTDKGADATAKFDGLGYAKLATPRIFASCLAENKEKLKDYLRKQKRADLIKEDVPAPSLSGYVGELVESGKPVPEFIGYYLKQSVRVY